MPDITIPDNFKCGLTGKLMTNPVRIKACGDVFESNALIKHTVIEGLPCPCCGNKDCRVESMPDLKKSIEAFVAANPQLKEQKTNVVPLILPAKTARARMY